MHLTATFDIPLEAAIRPSFLRVIIVKCNQSGLSAGDILNIHGPNQFFFTGQLVKYNYLKSVIYDKTKYNSGGMTAI